MKIEVIGSGEPEVAVVGLVHGDEVCGLRAINRLKEEVEEAKIELDNAVKLVLANEKAFNRGERFIDADLNRSFPGDKNSNKYEERLAVELKEELEGLKVLDLHASESPKTPFAIVSGLNEDSLELAKTTCMENLIEISYVEGGLIDVVDSSCVVECGFHNSKESAKVAYRVVMNFLAANRVLNESYDISDPEIYQVFDKEEGSGYEFVAENFSKVEKGEVFAEKEQDIKKASDEFYPILMSTGGYDDMIGFKAKKLQSGNEIK